MCRGIFSDPVACRPRFPGLASRAAVSMGWCYHGACAFATIGRHAVRCDQRRDDPLGRARLLPRPSAGTGARIARRIPNGWRTATLRQPWRRCCGTRAVNRLATFLWQRWKEERFNADERQGPQMNANAPELDAIAKRIIGCAFTVANTLGSGFLE